MDAGTSQHKDVKLNEYLAFLETKIVRFQDAGFQVDDLHPALFDFQEHIVRVALRKGRFAVFADCGLGKTLMQLVWADKVKQHTSGAVLILAPLAVSGQTLKEGEKFGIPLKSIPASTETGIYITNYEQIENIDCSLFAGIVLDESSILKNFDGKMKEADTFTFQRDALQTRLHSYAKPKRSNGAG
jgi:superfamily II DNA or RNA helicase